MYPYPHEPLKHKSIPSRISEHWAETEYLLTPKGENPKLLFQRIVEYQRSNTRAFAIVCGAMHDADA